MLQSDVRTQAHPLFEDLDESVDVDAESLWFDEIRRRDGEIRAGTAKLKPSSRFLVKHANS